MLTRACETQSPSSPYWDDASVSSSQRTRAFTDEITSPGLRDRAREGCDITNEEDAEEAQEPGAQACNLVDVFVPDEPMTDADASNPPATNITRNITEQRKDEQIQLSSSPASRDKTPERGLDDLDARLTNSVARGRAASCLLELMQMR